MQILGLGTVIAAGVLLNKYPDSAEYYDIKEPLDLLIAASVLTMLYETAAMVVRFLNVHFVNEYSRIVLTVVSTLIKAIATTAH